MTTDGKMFPNEIPFIEGVSTFSDLNALTDVKVSIFSALTLCTFTNSGPDAGITQLCD